MTATTLTQLFALMLEDHPSTLDGHGQWRDDLPVFGGAHAYGMNVWSWDETHLLIGTCADDLEVVPRGFEVN